MGEPQSLVQDAILLCEGVEKFAVRSLQPCME